VHVACGAQAALDGAGDEPGPAVGVVRAGERHAAFRPLHFGQRLGQLADV
jgi:hypothetical protein